MAVVKEISVKHCRKVCIDDDSYAGLSEEEIKRRNQQIKDHFNLIVRKKLESDSSA